MARVLIIDDDPAILALVSGILEAQGHSVIVTHDGQEGVKAFTNERFDLVVTDIVMPEQEGITTIGAIRRLNRTVPILAMSGSHTVGRYGGHLDAAAIVGANATLAKPLEPQTLIGTVDRLLQTHL